MGNCKDIAKTKAKHYKPTPELVDFHQTSITQPLGLYAIPWCKYNHYHSKMVRILQFYSLCDTFSEMLL